MENILGIPILHLNNVALDILPSLQEDIDKIYASKKHWSGRRGRYLAKSSLYKEDGTHKFISKENPMEGVTATYNLKQIVDKHALNYMKQFTLSEPSLRALEKFWHSYSWHSTMEAEDDYGWHAHNGYQLIATYYVRSDEEHAPIMFKNPISDLFATWLPGGKYNALEHTIKPKTGDLIIWPGWLEHQVPGYNFETQFQLTEEKTQYERNRISITMCYTKPGMQFAFAEEQNEQK